MAKRQGVARKPRLLSSAAGELCGRVFGRDTSRFDFAVDSAALEERIVFLLFDFFLVSSLVARAVVSGGWFSFFGSFRAFKDDLFAGHRIIF